MDLARLGFDFDGQGAAAAERAYDRLEAGAKGVEGATRSAERATDRLSRAARGLDPAVNDVAAAMRQQRHVTDALRASTGLTANETLNLSRQTADVAVSLASGMPIWMVAIQQGSQVGDTFQMAAQRGVGFRMALDSIYLRLAPLLAILAPVTIGVGALAAGWGLASRSITQDIGDVSREMGLTSEQLEHLKEKNISTTATAGDVWRGLGTTIREVFQETFGTQLDWVDEQWNSFLDDLTANTAAEVDAILGFFVGAYRGIVATWNNFPAVISDLTAMAANAGARNMNAFVQNSINELNVLREAWNAWARVTGNPGIIPEISAPGLMLRTDRATSGAVADVGAEIMGGYNSMQGATGRAGARWGQNTRASTMARGNTGLEDFNPADAERATAAARDIGEVMDRIQRISITPLPLHLEHAITPLDEMAERLAVIDGLTRDMATGLESAFGTGGRALGEMMTTMSGYQAQMLAWAAEEADMARRKQVDLFRLREIEAQRAQAQVQSYGDMASAAKGFFTEGSDGYRVMAAIEQAFRLQQLAGMLQSMIVGKQETASTIAGSMARGSAFMAEGAANMFARLGPYAFPAVAAMLGILAGLGLRGGGGGASGAPAANDNAPDAATNAVRAQSAQQAQARELNLAAVASRIEVRVTADREGMHAYVVGTAEKVAAPMAVQSGQVAARVGQSRTETAMARRQAYTVRG